MRVTLAVNDDMKHPAFFGYGSLVNRATHDYGRAVPATLSGWRRVWRHTALRPLAFLSVEPATGAQIDGLVATVPGGDWAALDLREAAYDRHPLAPDALNYVADWGADVQIYSVATARFGAAPNAHPILLSYLDRVVQGFAREYGADGVARFFATTNGWDAPVLNDRTAPRYPRHGPLSADDRACVDDALAALGVRMVQI